LDIGVIRAGGAELPMHEIEFELLAGPPGALLDLAARWVERHGLWLDVRSKAERGDRLARGLDRVRATTASAPTFARTLAPAAVVRTLIAHALTQVLPNAAEIADGRGEPEHLHQARVGLRRLRSVLGLFGDLLPAPLPAADLDALRTLFGRLGRQRDRDALAASLWPALQAAGAPARPDGEGMGADEADPDPADALLREPATTRLWLALLGLVHGAAAESATDGLAATDPALSMTEVARARIARLHRRVARDAARFDRLDDAARHALRKRLKRLRYAIELLAPLTRRQRARRYLKQLAPAQDALGRYNDLCTAEALCRDRVAPGGEPADWFALGWLAAQRPIVLKAAAKALRGLPAAPDFWAAD
jgi:inorganic triphosphatase YgiF